MTCLECCRLSFQSLSEPWSQSQQRSARDGCWLEARFQTRSPLDHGYKHPNLQGTCIPKECSVIFLSESMPQILLLNLPRDVAKC